jgi:C-terminal processing protease CtpA/Prc
VELGNGVTLFVPSWEDLRLDDTCLEGEGFAPDIEVKTTAKSFGKKDPVIEAALKFLREE